MLECHSDLTETCVTRTHILHLPTSVLEDIEERNIEDPTLCISDVFLEWEKQRSRAYTWEAIITALRSNDVEEDDFAQDLEAQLKVHQPCTHKGELVMYEQLNHGKPKCASFTRPTSITKYSKLDTKGNFDRVYALSNFPDTRERVPIT